MVLVGILLLSPLALVAVEAIGYTRGGYDSAFWKLELDDKLDHVAKHRRDWRWITIWALAGLFLLGGGVFGLSGLLADAGGSPLAVVAVGGFTVSIIAWVLGLTVQAAGVSEAAKQRVESGATPAWLHPLWNSAYVAEGVWIVGANLSYAVMGLAILQTGLIADWAGWVSLIGGVVIGVGVVLARDGFPQLGYLVPTIVGIAALIEGV